MSFSSKRVVNKMDAITTKETLLKVVHRTLISSNREKFHSTYNFLNDCGLGNQRKGFFANM